MFDVNEILAMLQNGETSETIAQKALDAVNEAARIQKEEEEKQARYEAEKALEAQKQMKLDSALDDMISAAIIYVDLIDEKFADELETWWENCSDEEVDGLHASVAALVGMYGALAQLDGILGNDIGLVSRLKVDPKSITLPAPKKIKSDDDILANFLTKIIN